MKNIILSIAMIIWTLIYMYLILFTMGTYVKTVVRYNKKQKEEDRYEK